MLFLYILSWLALIVQISFITIAIAAGLYYLAELVEEYTVVSKKIILWMTFLTLGFYICFFFFEELPTTMVICGIVSQVAHLYILKTFPFVVIFSPEFIVAVILIFINHYLAFQYFSSVYYSFSEISSLPFPIQIIFLAEDGSINELIASYNILVMAYFTLCLWMVPFALFVSLSANENVLPTVAESRPLLGGDNDDVVSNYFSRKSKKYGLLSLFNYLKDTLLIQRSKKTF